MEIVANNNNKWMESGENASVDSHQAVVTLTRLRFPLARPREARRRLALPWQTWPPPAARLTSPRQSLAGRRPSNKCPPWSAVQWRAVASCRQVHSSPPDWLLKNWRNRLLTHRPVLITWPLRVLLISVWPNRPNQSCPCRRWREKPSEPASPPRCLWWLQHVRRRWYVTRDVPSVTEQLVTFHADPTAWRPGIDSLRLRPPEAPAANVPPQFVRPTTIPTTTTRKRWTEVPVFVTAVR